MDMLIWADLVVIGFAFGVLSVMLVYAIAGWQIKRKERIQAGWKEEFREGLEAAIEELPVTYAKSSGESFKAGQPVYMSADGSTAVELTDTTRFIGRAIEDSVPIPDDQYGRHTVIVKHVPERDMEERT